MVSRETARPDGSRKSVAQCTTGPRYRVTRAVWALSAPGLQPKSQTDDGYERSNGARTRSRWYAAFASGWVGYAKRSVRMGAKVDRSGAYSSRPGVTLPGR